MIAISWTKAFAERKKYTLEDLQELVTSKSYKEAYLHLADIPPSQRKAQWKEVAVNASTGVLAALTFEDEADLYLLLQIETDFPIVLGAARYLTPRNGAVATGLTNCFANAWGVDHCVKIMKKLLDHTPDDRAFALQVAKVARLGMNPYNATPFFVRALGPKDNEAACKDDDLQYATIAGVATPKDSPWLAPSLKIADVCFAQLKTELVKAYEEGTDDGYVRANTCDFLKKRKAISASRACPK